MLSRLTSLIASSKNENDNDDINDIDNIDDIICKIKNLGKYCGIDNNNNNIIEILLLQKKYQYSLDIQRVSCHILSNLGMEINIAINIVENGGFELIRGALLRFESDDKLCWLGSSAIWNLARPPINRRIIGKKGVELMLKMLSIHFKKEKVINTSIGALSNLSLNDELKDIIGKEKNIKLILNVLNRYNSSSLSVSTSGAGLIANLAVSDYHALTLVSKNSIKYLLTLLQWKLDNNNNNTLFRNTCAALNNMVTADNFLNYFLENSSIEIIYKFLDNNNKNNNIQQFKNLLQNCLINIQIDINQKTTTYHLCVLHKKINILKKLLINNSFINLNKIDSKNMTLLDYAISSKNIKMITFLTKCGAIKSIKYHQQINNNNNNNKIKNAINDGIKILKNTQQIHQNIINQSLPNFPNHLCKFMIKYLNNIDMLQSIKQY